ncbi:hypothetical protein NL676_039651 [Syzygium grande]|nr:hypothetical protein NL676_039651 [Syzygium grande]
MSSGLESDDVPKSCLTEEEIRRVVREELKLVKSDLKEVRKEQKLLKSHLADLVRSCIRNTLKEEVVPAICSSLEDTSRKVVREELMKHASFQSAQLLRVHHHSSGDVRPKDGMTEGLNPVATDQMLLARGQT